MPNDRAGTWAQESLTPKLLLFNHSYFSKKDYRKLPPAFLLECICTKAIPRVKRLQSLKEPPGAAPATGGALRPGRSPRPPAASPEPGWLGPCGRLTWSEDGVPGLSVRLPDPGIEAPVQLDWGDHHLSKHAHHLWGHKCLSAPCSLSHRQPAIHEWRVLSKHILCSPKAGLPGMPLGSRHQSPPAKDTWKSALGRFPTGCGS